MTSRILISTFMNVLGYKMSRHTRLVLLQLLFTISLFVSVECQQCENSRYGYPRKLTCRNITGKFPATNTTIESFVCYDCNIPVIEEDTITKFRGSTFNLSYSHVQNITSTAFKSFTNTTVTFLFEGNDISYIAPGIFSNFSNIGKLNFKNNKISNLPNGTFSGTNTVDLDLSGNQLVDIRNSFAGLRLVSLNLSSNEIATIHEDTFDKTTFAKGQRWGQNIVNIDLSYNFITKIYPNAFKAKTAETCPSKIFLKNNRITTIENNTFSQLAFLADLNLEENYISELNANSFKGLVGLSTLSLRDNKLVNIPEAMFADLQRLTILDLSQNNLISITSTTFSGLTYLQKLNISHNNFKLLDNSHFLPLGGLNTLDISDTKLKKLDVGALLEHHYRLRVFVINDNFWNCKDLVGMYKKMNQKTGGFGYPSHHYDVPNLHGVACSRTELDSYDDITFEDFLSIISQDRVFEDLFDNRISNENSEEMLAVEDVVVAIKGVRSIFCLLTIITVLLIIFFVQFIVRFVYILVYKRNTIPSVCLSYSSHQDNVELM